MDQDFLLGQALEPEGLSVLFQPILQIGNRSRRIHALECLVRGPAGTALETPEALFGLARQKGMEVDLDRACLSGVLEAVAVLPEDLDLSVNVHASSLATDPEFCNFLTDTAAERAIPFARLIVEIVEHAPPWDVPVFRDALDALRHIGIRIALDDVGLGHANYRMIVESRPDYFKIDSYFVKGVFSDFYRQAVLESVCSLAHKIGAQVVAEGVDNEPDLEMVRELGVDFVQGYLFFRPLPASEFVG